MRPEEIRTIALIGRALWADPARSGQVTLETLGAVALLELPPDGTADRTLGALLSRAGRDVNAAAPGVRQPFFRLSSEERLILSALHRGKWSYERIGRILGRTREQIAEIAWAARLDLAFRPGMQIPLQRPVGPGPEAPHCPDFHPRRPWAQAFLDEQVTSREHLFFQEHMLRCETCRQAMARTRNLYFAVDALVPGAEDPDLSARIASLQRALVRSRAVKEPMSLTFGESLRVFFERPEIKRWILGAGVFLLVLLFVT